MSERKESGIYYQVQDLKQPRVAKKMSKADKEVLKVLDKAWGETELAIHIESTLDNKIKDRSSLWSFNRVKQPVTPEPNSTFANLPGCIFETKHNIQHK